MGKGARGLVATPAREQLANSVVQGPEQPMQPKQPATGAWAKQPATGAWATMSSYFLPEPAPDRPYVHPSQYKVVENVRIYSDGMDKDYTHSPWTLAFAGITLGLYVGIPHILLALLVLSWWSRAALWALALLLGSLLLPARPLRADSVLGHYLFLAWRRYFKFSFLFEQNLDCYKDYIIAQFPHGAFPIGCIVGGTFMATEFPEYHCYALAASSAFLVPLWRHVHAWLGTDVCTKTNFHRLLARGVQGPLHRRAAAAAAAAAAATAAAATAAAPAPAAVEAGAATAAEKAEAHAAETADADAAAAAAAGVPASAPAGAAITASPFAKALQRAAAAAADGVMAGDEGAAAAGLRQHMSQPQPLASHHRHSSHAGGEQHSRMMPAMRTAHSLSVQEQKLLHQRSSLRLSLADSIKASFKYHHTLSDTESSSEDSDCDSVSGGSITMRGAARHLSIGSGCSCSCGGAAEEEEEAAAAATSSTPSSCGGGGAGSCANSSSASSICSCCGGYKHIPLVTITSTAATSRLGKIAAAPASAADGMLLPADPQQQQQQQEQQISPLSAAAAADCSTCFVDPRTGRRKTGVSVGLMVGGIAEMFMIRRDHERIKLKDRKGFIRIAVEHGTDILPVYMFGTNQVLDFGPPWLQRLSRRMRASVGIIYGLWGLPIPRRRPIFMATGRPLVVGPPTRKDDPGFDARVDELHGQFVAEIQRVYYEHRGKYGHGFEERPLVIS